jgi:hypothetical protein
LFQTAFASGAAPFLFTPIAVSLGVVIPLLDFATKRGFAPSGAEETGVEEGEPADPLSTSLPLPAADAPLAARNVLFTDTGLKDTGFFTVELVRT